MATDTTYTLNGYDLNTVLGGTLLNATSWRADRTTRMVSVVIPGKHGELNPGLPTYEAPTIALEIEWVVSSQTDLEERVNHAQALLGQTNLSLGRASGGVVTSAPVRLVSISHSGFIYGMVTRAIVMLKLSQAFFRGAIADGAEIPFAGNFTNLDIPHLAGSTAPINDAIIRVAGPAGAVNVYDSHTGTGMTWTGTMAFGQYLFLCPNPLSARISSSSTAWYSGGTDQIGNVSWPAAGLLQMWPFITTSAVRRVQLTATGGGGRVSGQTKLTVRGARSYL